YVRLYIQGHAPGWGIVVSHFVLAATIDGAYVIDPQGGVRRPLKFYGGPNNVKETILITKHSLTARVSRPPAPAGASPLLVPASAAAADRHAGPEARHAAARPAGRHVGADRPHRRRAGSVRTRSQRRGAAMMRFLKWFRLER